MDINFKWIFIFICFLCFLSLSNVYAFEENNSTDLLQEDIICEPVLCENITNMNDTRINTYLNSSDVVKYYHDSERYGVYLFDDMGNALSNKNISFIINGMTYKRITNDYGYASMAINLNSGNYSASCFFNGDDYYKPCNCSNWIFVNSTIFADDLVKYFHNSSQYYSLFFSVNGIPLVNTTVTFNINGVFYNRTTNNSGWARLNINLNPGEYIITAYNPVSGEMHSNNITVLPILIAEDLYMGYRDGSCFEAIVLDNKGNPYPNQTVTFNINGIFYNRASDLYGVARLNINLMSGEYIITSYFNGAAIANRIVVGQSHFPISYSLIANNCNFYYGGDNIFEVRLVDNYGNFIPNKSILLTYNDYSLASMTDENSYAKWFIDWDVGSYDVSLSFRSNYPNDIINNTFKHINIYKSNIILCNNSSLSQYCGNSSFLYSVNVCDYFNHELCGLNISFNIENNTFYNVTNEEGIALYSFDLDIGEYALNVSFQGNNNFNPSFLIQNITVMNSIYVDKQECFYNQSNVTINIISNLNDFYYSFDNISWVHRFENTSILFMNGKWDLYYCNDFSNIHHYSFVVDNKSPIVFANIGSGIYTEPLYINLTSIDNTDDCPLIYYSLNNVSYTLYDGTKIFISNAYNHAILSFFSIDKYNHQSDIITINYFFNVSIANLNSGKFYSSVMDAINDYDTGEGNVIELYNLYSSESLIINKSITLKSTNSIFNYTNGNNIRVNTNNVILVDLNIISDAYISAIDISACNCTLLNCFINCSNSFSCVNIYGNENKLFFNNFINTNGYSFYLNSSQKSFLKNNIFNSYNGSILYNSSYNYLQNNTFIFNNYNCRLIFIDSFSNDIYSNNLTVGINLFNSGNNTFHSNWIYNKPKPGENTTFNNYYLINIDCPNYSNTFYLNYILFDYFVETHNINITSYSHVDLSDNWWGDHGVLSLINYKRYRDIVFNSYIVLNADISSYNVHEGLIYGANISCDLTHNSKGVDLSYKGFLPNNIPVKFENQTNSFVSYISEGHGSYYFEVNDDISNVIVSSDYMSKTLSINRSACARIQVNSTALYNNSPLNFNQDLYLNGSVNWVSLISHNINNFTDELDLIINGDIVKNFTITNSAYDYYKTTYRNEVFNAIHMYNDFLYNNISYIKAQFYVYTSLSNNTTDLTLLMNNPFISIPQYFLEWITSLIDINWKEYLLNIVLDYYNLTNNEKIFVKTHYKDFHDTVYVSISYPGDKSKNYIGHDVNNTFDVIFRGNQIYRSFDISYINGAYLHTDQGYTNNSELGMFYWINDTIYYNTSSIEGHYVNSDYDALETFTFVTTKLNESNLRYWLNEKNNYPEGFMKASYGTFLNGFLTLYCVDLIADIGSRLFNVTWNRNTPIAISVHDDFRYTFLSGECDFRFGMDVYGEINNIQAFNFLVSASFSQIEHWVMNALFPCTSPYGSVTYGLGNLLLDGNSLEVLFEDGFIIIREMSSNLRILVIDLVSGRVCDVFNLSYEGSYCYSNQQADWACDFGEKLLNCSEIFEILVNYYINITYDSLQNMINNVFVSIDEYLDDIDNNILGIIGSVAITVGIAALLVSNPAGWLILGGITLAAFGGILTYYADDLNKGWNYERGAWFFADIALSLPFGVLKSGGIVGKIIIKEYAFSNTEFVIIHSNDAFELVCKYYSLTKASITYEPYGTLKSVIISVYETTNPLTIGGKITWNAIKGIVLYHPIISSIINFIYEH